MADGWSGHVGVARPPFRSNHLPQVTTKFAFHLSRAQTYRKIVFPIPRNLQQRSGLLRLTFVYHIPTW